MHTPLAATLVLLLTFAYTVSAQESSQENPQDVFLNKVIELNDKLTELNKRIDALETELKEVRKLAEMSEHDKRRLEMDRQIAEVESRFNRGPDLEALSNITLPENANRGEVALYIRQILEASAQQQRTTSGDTQLEMFLKLEPENLDVMLDSLGNPQGRGGVGRSYLTQAIETLIESEEHKQLLLSYLAKQPSLISIVQNKGWIDEAKPIMLEALRNGTPVEVQQRMSVWYPIIAGMKDPETYPALIQFMETTHSITIMQVYGTIKDLPGIQLEESIHRTWKRIRETGNIGHYEGQFSLVALDHGNLDALGWLIELLGEDRFDQARVGLGTPFGPSVRETIVKHIDFEGSDEDIKAWYYKYKDRLKFDKQRKIFKK